MLDRVKKGASILQQLAMNHLFAKIILTSNFLNIIV